MVDYLQYALENLKQHGVISSVDPDSPEYYKFIHKDGHKVIVFRKALTVSKTRDELTDNLKIFLAKHPLIEANLVIAQYSLYFHLNYCAPISKGSTQYVDNTVALEVKILNSDKIEVNIYNPSKYPCPDKFQNILNCIKDIFHITPNFTIFDLGHMNDPIKYPSTIWVEIYIALCITGDKNFIDNAKDQTITTFRNINWFMKPVSLLRHQSGTRKVDKIEEEPTVSEPHTGPASRATSSKKTSIFNTAPDKNTAKGSTKALPLSPKPSRDTWKLNLPEPTSHTQSDNILTSVPDKKSAQGTTQAIQQSKPTTQSHPKEQKPAATKASNPPIYTIKPFETTLKLKPIRKEPPPSTSILIQLKNFFSRSWNACKNVLSNCFRPKKSAQELFIKAYQKSLERKQSNMQQQLYQPLPVATATQSNSYRCLPFLNCLRKSSQPEREFTHSNASSKAVSSQKQSSSFRL